MKKIKICPVAIVAILTLFSSCNNMRYAHLKKIDAHYTQTVSSPKERISVATEGFSAVPLKESHKIMADKRAELKLLKKKNSFVILPLASAEEKQVFTQKKSKLIAADRGNGSFLWTIILVLLVIWLLAFLTGGWGLGGLIYLFLVVALVMLLLRLLGII